MSARKAAAAKLPAKPPAKPSPRSKSATPRKSLTGEPASKPAKPEASSEADVSIQAKKLAADIDRALAQGQIDLLSKDAVQALMAAACRSYSAQIEAGGSFPPLAERSRVTSTDVMVTASGLLKSANLAVFELGMWQSWTGR
jgi:hypothetical protein